MAEIAYEHIATATFSNSGLVSVTGFGTDYKDIRVIFRADSISGEVRPKLRLSGSSSLRRRLIEYGDHRGPTVTGNSITGDVYTSRVNPGGDDGIWTITVYDVQSVSEENVAHVLLSNSASSFGEAAEFVFDYLTSGAVTEIGMDAINANWGAGQVDVYGRRG